MKEYLGIQRLKEYLGVLECSSFHIESQDGDGFFLLVQRSEKTSCTFWDPPVPASFGGCKLLVWDWKGAFRERFRLLVAVGHFAWIEQGKFCQVPGWNLSSLRGPGLLGGSFFGWV